LRVRIPIAAFAAALGLWAWNSDQGWGLPLPPLPRMPSVGGGLPRNAMGPVGGSEPPRGISVPGAIGGLERRSGAISRPGQAAGIGGPGGIAGPRRSQATSGPGSFREPSHLRGLGGLGSLARSGAVPGKFSTAAVNRRSLANQGNQVRRNYNHYDCFHGHWWGRHSGAWRAARWAEAVAYYRTATWDDCYGYGGYYAEPYYYDYGSNVIYEGDNVYVNGDPVATQEEYTQQAITIADTGRQARAAEDEEWLPLGIFAIIQREQANGNYLFQLAVNRSGIIRGNYYDALSDTNLPVYGAVDEKTQRAAWTIGERKASFFEAGFANLAEPETTILVHFGKERTLQWTLVRIDPSAEPDSALLIGSCRAMTNAARGHAA